jgi:hypothetical protein
MELRKQSVRDYKIEAHGVKDPCATHGLGRQAGTTGSIATSKGLADPMQGGWSADRSHVAHSVHKWTGARVEEALMQTRTSHPTCGARKLMHQVAMLHPTWALPHESTVCDMLRRNGMVQSRPRRRTVGHLGRSGAVIDGQAQCWSADFKSQFRKSNNRCCNPPTMTDNHNRYLLACQGMDGPRCWPARRRSGGCSRSGAFR